MTEATAAPRRRFWQIHLSTALLLMLTSALLMYLNLRRVYRVLPPGETANFGWNSVMHPEPPTMDYIIVAQRPGWPVTSNVVIAYKAEKPFNGLYQAGESFAGVNWAVKPDSPEQAVEYGLRGGAPARDQIWNASIAAAILLTVLVVAEWFARRRGSTKSPPSPAEPSPLSSAGPEDSSSSRTL